MKKLLSLVMMWMVALNTFATFVCTFDPAVDKDVYSDEYYGSFELRKNGITVKADGGRVTDAHYRVYKNHNMTISSSSGPITDITIECIAPNGNQYGPGCFVCDTGNYDWAEKIGQWSGESDTVIFTASTAQVRISLITVTIDGDGSEEITLMPPIITPETGVYTTPIQVKMRCTTSGAVIHYTTDGSEPTTASAAYEVPFNLNENCTVKAISAIDSLISPVVSATYEFQPRIYGLGDAGSLPTGATVEFGYDATVLYNDYYITFLKDETGYAALNIDHMNLNDGDVIQAGYTATAGGSFNLRMAEISNASGLRVAPYPNQPIARQVSIRQLGSCMPGEFVVLRDVSLNPYTRTLTDAQGNSCGVYQNFNFPTVVPNSEYEYVPDDQYVIVLNSNLVYLTRNIHYYGLGYDYSGLRDNDEVRLRFNTTVLYQHGDCLFVKDCTGYGMIYGLSGYTFAPGDVIPPEIYLKKTFVDGEVRLKYSRFEIRPVSDNVPVEPEVIGVNDMGHSYWAHYVVLRDVTVSALENGDFIVTDAQGNTCFGRNSFGQTLPEGHYHELLGIVDCYQSSEGGLVYGLLPIVNTIAEVSTLNELYALEGTQIARFTEPLTVIYQYGPMLYVTDKEYTDGLVYGTQTSTFSNGDIIGNAVGHWSIHNFGNSYYPRDSRVVIPIGNWEVSGQGAAIRPAEINIEDITPDMEHRFVEVRDLLRYFSNELYKPGVFPRLTLDNKFRIDMPTLMNDKMYDVIGFLASYGIIYPLEVIEHDIVTYPAGDVNGDNEVNVSDIGALIHVIEGAHDNSSGPADVNGDGEVNISDVNSVISIILSDGPHD